MTFYIVLCRIENKTKQNVPKRKKQTYWDRINCPLVGTVFMSKVTAGKPSAPRINKVRTCVYHAFQNGIGNSQTTPRLARRWRPT